MLLRGSTRPEGRVDEKEEMNENYARFSFCRNSLRLRVASMVKTVSKETTSIEIKAPINK
jgi:hypothetical protein